MSIRTTSVFLAAAVLIGVVVASSPQCGIAATIPKEYVAHGHSSLLGQWPWHGALLHRIDRNAPSYACGVTVVSNFYTLTAAHCTMPELKHRYLKAKELLIRLGTANLEKMEHCHQQFGVKKIVRHEEYRSLSMGNDIALLKVDREIEFNDYVRPICFWKGDDSVADIVGKNGYSPGWGMDEHGNFAKELKHAVMPIASREKCRQSDTDYYTHYLFDRKAFCAGRRNGTSVSNGDSGGGLYILVDNVWYLRGIVSNGKATLNGKLDTNNFVVYTDVAYYLPWVKQTLDITMSDEKYAECGLKTENLSYRSQLNHRPWPWHGEVYRNGSKPHWLGDIAIINRNFVLSQATVFTQSDYTDPFRLMVLFKTSRNEAERTILQVFVKAIIPIRKWESPQKENNIAILQLDKPLIFSDIIRPICLWRADNTFSMINDTIVYLGRVRSNPLTGQECSRHTNPRDAIANSLCVRTTKKEYVRMFSSNIMFLQYNGKWFARGISYGSAKNGSTYFIYLLDLALYTGWIEQSIAGRSEMLLPLSSCVAGSTQDWNVRLHSISNQCYGSLITPYLILTTAYCMIDFNHLDRNTILRISNSRNTDIVNVIEVFKHPFFHEIHLTHNVALVQIEKPFYAAPVCIYKNPSYSGQLFFTTWQLYTELNQSLSLTDMNDCNRKWRKQEVYVNLDGAHICGHLNVQSTALNCQLDLSGSPLSYRIGRKQFLQGILDFGKTDKCAVGGLPAGFINVTFYSSWIYQTFETVRNYRVNIVSQESHNEDVDQYENFNNVADTVLPQLRNIGDQIKMSVKDDGIRNLIKNVQNYFG